MKISDLFLFNGITEDEFTQKEQKIYLRERRFSKGEVVFGTGQCVREAGVVLTGGVMIETVDPEGKKSILSRVGNGGIFAETYALCGEPLMVDAVCSEESLILFVNLDGILKDNPANAPWRFKTLKNLLLMSANKNLTLSRRIFCTAPKGIRAKVTAYLKAESIKNDSNSFKIPFNRYQMADYLGVDRSALSKELSAMRDEGLIEFRKNQFRLLPQAFND